MANLTFVATPNTEKKSVEITFSGKPSADTRKEMKNKGFIWNKTKMLWYVRLNHTNRFKQSNTWKSEDEMAVWLQKTIDKYEPVDEQKPVAESVKAEPELPKTDIPSDLKALIEAEVAKRIAEILGEQNKGAVETAPENIPEPAPAPEKKGRKSKIPGGAKRRDALKRIYTKAPSDKFKGRWLDEQGRECYCDGFRSVRLNVPVGAGAELVQGMDLSKVFKSFDEYEVLTLPTMDELTDLIKKYKEANKTAKKGYKKKAIYDFGENLPKVDANYLKDMLEIFPDATLKAFVKDGAVRAKHPIYVESADGDGLLCPLNV